ncbi:MAG TPA: HD domain-containing phosphohydrolase [Rubrivivax sp.]|nr:HD domain-containing phosphohydrolase [Rubrivivax sp.]
MNAPERLPGCLPDGAFAAMAPPGCVTTVLCVDDEPNILSALKRTLRGAGYGVLTATSGEQALQMLEDMADLHPVNVVLSDMRMPGMDGAQLLEQVHARWPELVRILLTGQANVEATVAAINRGRILRYLSKPWDEAELLATVYEGVERQALEREKTRLQALAERQNQELKQLNGELETRVQARTLELSEANQKLQRNHLKTIKVFSNLLELRGDQMAGHGRRVADTARDIARAMALGDSEVLRVFMAALLHDIGLIGNLDKLLAKPLARLSPEEMGLYRGHPIAAEQSLLALDDMAPLLPFIRGHHERFDGAGFPDKLAGTAIPLGARIIAVADTFDDLQSGQLIDSHLTMAEARTMLRQGRGTQFCPEVIDVFLHITEPRKFSAASAASRVLRVPSAALEPDMVLAADLVSTRGVLMLTAGHRLTPSLIKRVREFEMREGGQLQIHIKPRTTE